MTSTAPSPHRWQHGTRKREDRPERIDIEGDVLIRNDIIAAQQGGSERSLNRGDSKGAPFTFINGVKYRPERAYREYLAGQVQRQGQPPKRRGSRAGKHGH
jgi:hypothetical protein